MKKAPRLFISKVISKKTEGVACKYRDNILNGEYPRGECIGEFLRVHGEKELIQFFVKAIAYQVGYLARSLSAKDN